MLLPYCIITLHVTFIVLLAYYLPTLRVCAESEKPSFPLLEKRFIEWRC